MHSHFPALGMSINLGIVSVICFYFISGYLMRKSYARFQENSCHPTIDFYIDRSIKLFPQYLIVVCITAACIHWLGPSERVPLLNQEITIDRMLLNIFLLPVNYVFEPLSIKGLLPHPLIPPAWSLSAEFHFYLLLPFIFLLKKRFWLLLLLITMGIQFSSFFFAAPEFNSNNFGYRYIFGVLTIFLYGFAFADNTNPFFKQMYLLIWAMFTIFLFLVAPAFTLWKNQWVQEILIGGFIALPVGYCFSKIKTRGSYGNTDIILGKLAYPVFISHSLSFYLTEQLIPITSKYNLLYYIVSLLFCFIISFLLMLFQNRIETYRIRRRGFASLLSVGKESAS